MEDEDNESGVHHVKGQFAQSCHIMTILAYQKDVATTTQRGVTELVKD